MLPYPVQFGLGDRKIFPIRDNARLVAKNLFRSPLRLGLKSSAYYCESTVYHESCDILKCRTKVFYAKRPKSFTLSGFFSLRPIRLGLQYHQIVTFIVSFVLLDGATWKYWLTSNFNESFDESCIHSRKGFTTILPLLPMLSICMIFLVSTYTNSFPILVANDGC